MSGSFSAGGADADGFDRLPSVDWFHDGPDVDVDDDEWEYYYAQTPPPRVDPDILSAVIQDLRSLGTGLRAEQSIFKNVPSLLANRLMEMKGNPAINKSQTRAETGVDFTAAEAAMRRGDPSAYEKILTSDIPSGTPCNSCGDPIPERSMGRGRPRTLCLKCSPRKNPGKNTK